MRARTLHKCVRYTRTRTSIFYACDIGVFSSVFSFQFFRVFLFHHHHLHSLIYMYNHFPISLPCTFILLSHVYTRRIQFHCHFHSYSMFPLTLFVLISTSIYPSHFHSHRVQTIKLRQKNHHQQQRRKHEKRNATLLYIKPSERSATTHLESDEEVSQVQLEGVQVHLRVQQPRHEARHLGLGEVGEGRQKEVPHEVRDVLPVTLFLPDGTTGGRKEGLCTARGWGGVDEK